MKYDATLVNQAKVGDLVYGYDDLNELREAIEGDDEENLCKSVELVRNVAGIKIVYDCKTDSFQRVEYVYPISEAVEESRIERMLRILARSAHDTGYRPLVIEQFFKLKKRGLVTSPKTDDEEIVLDWSYDLEDDEDKENLEKELSELSFFDKAFFLRNVSIGERYFVKTKDNILVNPRRVDEFFYAICNLLTRALDSLV